MTDLRHVAVFDIGLPPGIAFIRSLRRAGVPFTVYAPTASAAGRWSRHVREFRRCPPLRDVDAFADWLAGEMAAGRIDLVAPTSDWITFCAAEARARVGIDDDAQPAMGAVLDCLLKDRFARAMEAIGFGTPATVLPTSTDEAVALADALGYPVVMKPRSHVGIGRYRGEVLLDETDVRAHFRAYPLEPGHGSVARHDPDLGFPLLQQFVPPGEAQVVSITGCLAPDGEVLALGHSRKLRQWPPRLGVGTVFESVGEQWYSAAAVAAVQAVLGRGLFELEIVTSTRDPELCLAIDLNPRAFGQVSLDIAQGRDLPVLWYRSVTGAAVEPVAPRRPPVRHWQQAVPFYAGMAIVLALGPGRAAHLHELRNLASLRYVGATRSLTDPLPSVLLAGKFLRHPGGLVRPYLKQRKSALAAGAEEQATA